MKRLKVKNDFIFQKIFGESENKEILISFLNAVLELEDVLSYRFSSVGR
jgi:predicted transposase/invertase (TIGR01784 family)